MEGEQESLGMSGVGALAGEGGAGWSQAAAGEPASGGGDGPPNVDAAFKLQVEEGSTVSATFPFFGDIAGGQLSFQIGDHITVSEIRLYLFILGSGHDAETEFRHVYAPQRTRFLADEALLEYDSWMRLTRTTAIVTVDLLLLCVQGVGVGVG